MNAGLKNIIWYLTAAAIKSSAPTSPKDEDARSNLHPILDRQTERGKHSRPSARVPGTLRLVKPESHRDA
jgi:hypothetical protein